MAAPLVAAAGKAAAAALKLLKKKAIGKAINFVKRYWKEILCSGLAIQVIIWGTVIAVLLNLLAPPGQAQAQSLAAAGPQPMPNLADALQDPTHKPFIEAVQRVAGVPLDATSLKAGASAVEQQHWQRMVLLLSMAWVDSRWGTQASAYPIGGTGSVTGKGARAVAQAVIAAGMSPSDINGITMAVAIAGAESGWNPTATNPNTNGSTDYGLWQINSIHISPPTVPPPPQLFDPLVNARAMMLISSNGTNWRPWCTAWSNGACGGVYQGAGAPFQRPENWGPAQAAVLQISLGAPATGSLADAAGFTGVVLMPGFTWAHAPGVTDPNSPAQVPAIVTFVDSKLPQGDPQKALTTFYGADPSVAFHVKTVMTVDQMSFGRTPQQIFAADLVPLWWTATIQKRWDPTGEVPGTCIGQGTNECGTDFAMPVGTRVAAIAGGTVVNLQNRLPESLGYVIQIETADHHLWHYEHMSTTTLKQGDAVYVGEVIGTSGGLTPSGGVDGYSRFPHIEVRYAPQFDPGKTLWLQGFIDPLPMIQQLVTTPVSGNGGAVRERIVALASSQVGVTACDRAPQYGVPGAFWCGNSEWCAYFASWVWQQQGIPIPTEALSGAFVGWAQANSTFRPIFSTPLRGDVLVWASRDHPEGAHVSIVVAANGPNSIETIDGNWYVNNKSQVASRTWYNPNAMTNGWHVLGYASPVRGA